MRRGGWHQFGDRSQKLALEILQRGRGVGVILSPRDLSENGATEYASHYRRAGADIIVDQQFYVPNAAVGKLPLWGISKFRVPVSELRQVSDNQIAGLAGELERQHRMLGATAVLAPGLVYEAGRPGDVDLNRRLFTAAKAVGDALGIPTYATVVLGRTVTGSDELTTAALSAATALDADGWYFAFQFGEGRIPGNQEFVYRACCAGLTLATTGKPVLHAYAGPMALLSLGFGAAAAAVGHSQNVWQFTPGRWESRTGSGGGGDAPPRLFSAALWGTIVYPDEWVNLSLDLRRVIHTPTPFSAEVSLTPPFLAWDRWKANKHLVMVILKTIDEIAKQTSPQAARKQSVEALRRAVVLHERIRTTAPRIELRDRTASYQAAWHVTMNRLGQERRADYDFLDLLAASV